MNNLLIGIIIGIGAMTIVNVLLSLLGDESDTVFVLHNFMVMVPIIIIVAVGSVIVLPFYYFFRTLFIGCPEKRFNSVDCPKRKLFGNVYLCRDRKASRWFKKFFLVRVKRG